MSPQRREADSVARERDFRAEEHAARHQGSKPASATNSNQLETADAPFSKRRSGAANTFLKHPESRQSPRLLERFASGTRSPTCGKETFGLTRGDDKSE